MRVFVSGVYKCVNVHVQVFVRDWRPEVAIVCLPPLLSTFVLRSLTDPGIASRL